jgi:hypothetical protein
MMRAATVLHGSAVKSLHAADLAANRWTCFSFQWRFDHGKTLKKTG